MFMNKASVQTILKNFQDRLRRLEKQYNTKIELGIHLYGGSRTGVGKDPPVLVSALVGDIIAFQDELGDLEQTLAEAMESIQVVLDYPES